MKRTGRPLALPIWSEIGRNDAQKQRVRDTVLENSNTKSSQIVDAIASALCESPNEALGKLWCREIEDLMREFHRKLQSAHSPNSRLDFEEICDSLAATWLEEPIIKFGFWSERAFFAWLRRGWTNQASSVATQQARWREIGGRRGVSIGMLPDNLQGSEPERTLVEFREIAKVANWTKLEDYVLTEFALGGKTQRELGIELGFSPPWIGQILKSAIRKGRIAFESLH